MGDKFFQVIPLETQVMTQVLSQKQSPDLQDCQL